MGKALTLAKIGIETERLVQVLRHPRLIALLAPSRWSSAVDWWFPPVEFGQQLEGGNEALMAQGVFESCNRFADCTHAGPMVPSGASLPPRFFKRVSRTRLPELPARKRM
jgi:hypothetical protein